MTRRRHRAGRSQFEAPHDVGLGPMLPVWRRYAPRTMVVGIVAALSLPFAFAAPVGASPQDDLDHERATAEQLEAKISDLNQRISVLDENYNEGQLEIAQTTATIEDAQL